METDSESFSFIGLHLPLLLALPTEVVTGLVSMVLLLACSGLISGSEVAFFSLTHNEYERLQQENSAAARRILWLKDKPRRLLATILISNNFINVAIVLLSDFVLQRLLPQTAFETGASRLIDYLPWFGRWSAAQVAGGLSFAVTVVGATFLLVLFGEVAPKVYARFNSERIARFMAAPIMFLLQVFHPLNMLLINGTGFIERRLAHRTAAGQITSREDIDEAIDLAVNSEVDTGSQDVDILKRIVKFNEVSVRQIMRSRVDVVAVDQSITYAQLLETVRESGYSRIPVYNEDFDNVVGILYVKDLLGHLGEPPEFAWQELVRTELLFVPENKRINELLRDFQKQKLHMAVVVDEYGGSAGIVTLEDVLEEVIGDIQDEFDDEPEVIYQKVDDLNYIFDGKTMLNDVCRTVGIPTSTFDEVRGEADSFAGLILEILGDMPQPDQEITYEDFRFKVVSVNERRIEEILITLPDSLETEE